MTPMTVEELLPCPFCGGEARYFGEALMCCVSCTKCKAQMGWVIEAGETAQVVKDAWNRRPDDALRAKAEKLAEALEDARETILQLLHMRGCEAEGSDEDWVADIDAALADWNGGKG